MHLYQDQFSTSHDFPSVKKPSKFLIIASTPRSGSHMLGHALHMTGKFGFPLEYANQPNLSEWKKRLASEDIREVMKRLQERRTSPNGVFGIKIHYSHIRQFKNFATLMELFPDAFFVFLTRRNLLRQAVSLAISSQSGVWISGQQGTGRVPSYDYAEINDCLRKTIIDNSSWKYTLATSGCNYLEISFEDVRQDMRQSINRIGDFLGVEISEADIPSTPVTAKQGDATNDLWVERFLLDHDRSQELLPGKSSEVFKKLFRKVRRQFRR